jgi:hypothetical protein
MAALFQAVTHRFDKDRFQVHNIGVVGPDLQTRAAQKGSTYDSRNSAQVNPWGVLYRICLVQGSR